MKIPHPWKCDSCNAIKQPSNNWLIVEFSQGYALTVQVPLKRLAIFEWNEQLAEQTNVKHVCGQKCAIDQIAKLFPELGIEKPKHEPEREIR